MKNQMINLLMAFLGLAATNLSHAGDHTMTAPEDVLVQEHEAILIVVDALRGDVEKLRSGETVSLERISKGLDFFINFADACHHRKEEQVYFPASFGKDTGKDPLRSRLLADHELYRIELKQVQRAVEAGQLGLDTAATLGAYLAQVAEHIRVENTYFAKMRDERSRNKDNSIVTQFQEIESDLGENFHERYHGLAMELAGKN